MREREMEMERKESVKEKRTQNLFSIFNRNIQYTKNSTRADKRNVERERERTIIFQKAQKIYIFFKHDYGWKVH